MSSENEWVKLGVLKDQKTGVYFQKREIYEYYDADWIEDNVDLEKNSLAGGKFGGLIAVLGVPYMKKNFQGETEGMEQKISIYSPSGKRLCSFPWKEIHYGSIKSCGFDSKENLILVTDRLEIYIFDLFGRFQKKIQFKEDIVKERLLQVKVYDHGVVVLTRRNNVFVVTDMVDENERYLRCNGKLNIKFDEIRNPDEDIKIEVVERKGTKEGEGDHVDVYVLVKDVNSISLISTDRSREPFNPTFKNHFFKDFAISPNGNFLACTTGKYEVVFLRNNLIDYSRRGLPVTPGDGLDKIHPGSIYWCGNDCVVLYWGPKHRKDTDNRSVLYLIGKSKVSKIYHYDGPLLLITEVDGLRIVSEDRYEFLSRVPKENMNIFRVGSLDSSALLFDSYAEFMKHQASSNKILNEIRKANELGKAVRFCIVAAGNEFDPQTQGKLLKAASYGKNFLTTYEEKEEQQLLIRKYQDYIRQKKQFDANKNEKNKNKNKKKKKEEETEGEDEDDSDEELLKSPKSKKKSKKSKNEFMENVMFSTHLEFVKMCKHIRILNGVRNGDIGIPISYFEFKYLGEQNLVERLFRRHHHAVGIKLSEYLDLEQQRKAVLIHWACTKVQSRDSTESILENIKYKCRNEKSVNFGKIALSAFRCNKKALATRLLEWETDPGEQVRVLLEMSNQEDLKKAQYKALQSGNMDLIFLVLTTMAERLDFQNFIGLLYTNYKSLVKFFESYCYKVDHEESMRRLRKMYRLRGLNYEMGIYLLGELFKFRKLFQKFKKSYETDETLKRDEKKKLKEEIGEMEEKKKQLEKSVEEEFEKSKDHFANSEGEYYSIKKTLWELCEDMEKRQEEGKKRVEFLEKEKGKLLMKIEEQNEIIYEITGAEQKEKERKEKEENQKDAPLAVKAVKSKKKKKKDKKKKKEEEIEGIDEEKKKELEAKEEEEKVEKKASDEKKVKAAEEKIGVLQEQIDEMDEELGKVRKTADLVFRDITLKVFMERIIIFDVDGDGVKYSRKIMKKKKLNKVLSFDHWWWITIRGLMKAGNWERVEDFFVKNNGRRMLSSLMNERKFVSLCGENGNPGFMNELGNVL